MAMAELGAHFNRLGDLDTAHEWFFRSAEAGNARAAAYLGWLFNLYGGVEDAIRWTRIAIERGDVAAQAQLERLLDKSVYNPLDPTVMMVMHRNRRDAHAAIAAGNENLAARLLAVGEEWGDAESFFMLGEWWGRQGTSGHAILYYQRTLSLSPQGHSRAEEKLRALSASLQRNRVQDRDTPPSG